MLTVRQRAVLQFIDGFVKANDGVAPSNAEIAEGLNLKSKSGIHRVLTALDERGFIKRLPHRARAIEVLRLSGESDVLSEFVRAARDLEKKAGARIAIAVMTDLATEMLAKHETTILPTTAAVGNA